jgi:hypothetical protein
MRSIFFIIACCLALADIQAQKITQEYNNVSLSEALRQLDEQTDDYTISFLYNELEDFRITTSIHRKSIPDAIRQMIGFYPIRMTVENKEVVVECAQKTTMRYIGNVIDEQGQPVAYANVALLSPQDSTLITGGVSNEGGLFVVPCEQKPVLARISFVGYKTGYVLFDSRNVGHVRLKCDTIVLNGVQVRGERQIVKAENGHLTYNIPQLLEILPADNAFEALTRIPGVTGGEGGLSFAGRSVTLVINGKPTTLSEEQVVERLKQMPASQIAKAEVLPAAPAKYHVRGMAINVVTKDFAWTNQFSGQLMSGWQQSKYGKGYFGGSFIYNHDKLGVDVSYAFAGGSAYGQVERNANHPLGEQRIAFVDKTNSRGEGIDHKYHIGLDYAIADDHRLSLAYTGEWNSTRSTNNTTGTALSTQHSRQHDYLHNVDAYYSAPFGLQLGISYTNYQNPRTQNLNGRLYDISRKLYVDSRQKVGKWLFTVDQTQTLSKSWKLNYGGKAQLANNNSYQTTLDENRQPLSDATSHVDYDERILNAYVGLYKQVNESLSLDASITTEQYHATKWNEWRVYPQLNALWNIDAKNILNLSFSSESEYPSYWSTMSSIYYASAYSEIWGNPDLKPRSSYNLNLMWQLKQKYTFLAFANFEPDYFVQLAYQPSDRMAVIMKETNWDYSNHYGLQASIQYRLGNWLNGQINTTVFYRHDKCSHFFDLLFNRTCLSGVLGGMAVAKLSSRHNIQLILHPLFQSKTIQGVYDIDPLFQLSATFRFTSSNGKWSLVAKGENILNTHINTRSCISNQNYSMRIWMPYTNYSLTAIYRIGGFKEKKTKAVDTSRMGY